MPRFINTTGRQSLGIAICARCNRKFPYDDLMPDPNFPGLRVCSEDRDAYDPWRLPPPQNDAIALDYPRPDTPMYPFDDVFSPIGDVPGVTRIQPTYTWTPSMPYLVGASVTPLNVNDPATPLPQMQFVALTAGQSGALPPVWAKQAGVKVPDGTLTWLCVGIALLDGITEPTSIFPP